MITKNLIRAFGLVASLLVYGSASAGIIEDTVEQNVFVNWWGAHSNTHTISKYILILRETYNTKIPNNKGLRAGSGVMDKYLFDKDDLCKQRDMTAMATACDQYQYFSKLTGQQSFTPAGPAEKAYIAIGLRG